VNLDDFVPWQPLSFRFCAEMQIINILGHEQKRVRMRR
jgi:hypothetical protein